MIEPSHIVKTVKHHVMILRCQKLKVGCLAGGRYNYNKSVCVCVHVCVCVCVWGGGGEGGGQGGKGLYINAHKKEDVKCEE